MSYIITTDNLPAWECKTLKDGAEALGRDIADNGRIEPSIAEIWLYEENIPLSIDVVKRFENDMLSWAKWRREEIKENELDFRKYGNG